MDAPPGALVDDTAACRELQVCDPSSDTDEEECAACFDACGNDVTTETGSAAVLAVCDGLVDDPDGLESDCADWPKAAGKDTEFVFGFGSNENHDASSDSDCQAFQVPSLLPAVPQAPSASGVRGIAKSTQGRASASYQAVVNLRNVRIGSRSSCDLTVSIDQLVVIMALKQRVLNQAAAGVPLDQAFVESVGVMLEEQGESAESMGLWFRVEIHLRGFFAKRLLTPRFSNVVEGMRVWCFLENQRWKGRGVVRSLDQWMDREHTGWPRFREAYLDMVGGTGKMREKFAERLDAMHEQTLPLRDRYSALWHRRALARQESFQRFLARRELAQKKSAERERILLERRRRERERAIERARRKEERRELEHERRQGRQRRQIERQECLAMLGEDLAQRRVELRSRVTAGRIRKWLRRLRGITDRAAARYAGAVARAARWRRQRAEMARARLAARQERLKREATRKRMRQDLTMEELLGRRA